MARNLYLVFAGVVPSQQAHKDVTVGRQGTSFQSRSLCRARERGVPGEAGGGAVGEGDEQGVQATAVGGGNPNVPLSRQHSRQAVQVFGLLDNGNLLNVAQMLCRYAWW